MVLDGLPGLYGFKYDSATACGCHCTCTLINWSVLRQLALEQDSTLIITCVFKTKVFVSENPSLATNSYIIGI